MSKDHPTTPEAYRALVVDGMLDYNVDADWLQKARLVIHDGARAQEKLDKLQAYLTRCAVMREEPKKRTISDLVSGKDDSERLLGR